jgi:polyisoprenoid-binding protein YceI
MNSKILKVGGGAVVALALLVGLAAWQLGWFSSEPAAVSIDAALESVATTTEPATDNAPDESDSVTETTVAVQTVQDLAGSWTVEQSDATFVGYRIEENLSGADIEAVGRTKSVTGTLVADSSKILEVTIDASLIDLTSDSRIRDSQLKSQALQTSQFPDASFVLTSPISVGTIPVDGTAIAFVASGDLTLHGVTRSIDVPIQAATSDGKLIVIGAAEVALADFEIDTPKAPVVASVSDIATMELSLLFVRQ